MTTIESNNDRNQAPQPARSGKGWKIALAVVAVTFLGFNVYLLSKVSYVEGQAEVQRQELTQQIATLEEQLAQRQGASARELESLRQEVHKTSQVAFSNARSQARRESDRVAKMLEEKQKAQAEREQQLISELGGVKDQTATNRFDLNQVRDTVDGVQGEVESTRSKLDETSENLAKTRGDVGQLSGQVGSHAEQIEKLRRQGERDVIEFTLAESKDLSRVGDVSVRLKDTDPGKNRFTIEVLANDQLIRQKDRYANEPVQFYPDGFGAAYQIVVTDVAKDKVSGYLIRPKFAQMASK